MEAQRCGSIAPEQVASSFQDFGIEYWKGHPQIKSSGNSDVRTMGWQVGLGATAKRFSPMSPIVSGTGWQ
jgi:hypothetical protein